MKGVIMSEKKRDNKNILFVTIFIGSMLIFMLGTVIYVTSQVANCSSVKKARKMCINNSMMHKNKMWRIEKRDRGVQTA